jgi:hypothetical protein
MSVIPEKRVVNTVPDSRIMTVAVFMLVRVLMSVAVVVRVVVVVILPARLIRLWMWQRRWCLSKAAMNVHVQCRDAGHFPSLYSGYRNAKIFGDFR